MIFTLSNEFDGFNWAENAQYLTSIRNIITAHVAGWHVFAPGARVLSELLKLDELGDDAKAVLRFQILERRATLMGQARSVSKLAYCVPDGSTDLGFDDRCLVTPLSEFSSLDDCQKTRFLVENPTHDGAFYRWVAEHWGMGNGLRLPLRFQLVHGGGGDIATEFNRYAREDNSPLIAIVDSDKACPTCAMGDVAKRLKNAARKISGLRQASILGCRSVENLVPIWCVKSIIEEDVATLTVVSAAEKVIENSEDSEFREHWSLKKGLKLGDLRKSKGNMKRSLQQYLANLGIAYDPVENRDVTRDSEPLVIGRYPNMFSQFVMLFVNSDTGNVRSGCVSLVDTTKDASAIMHDLIAFGLGGQRSAAAMRLAPEA